MLRAGERVFCVFYSHDLLEQKAGACGRLSRHSYGSGVRSNGFPWSTPRRIRDWYDTFGCLWYDTFGCLCIGLLLTRDFLIIPAVFGGWELVM